MPRPSVTSKNNTLKIFSFLFLSETILGALRTITLKAGSNMGDTIRSALLETLEELISSTDVCCSLQFARIYLFLIYLSLTTLGSY